MYASITDEVGPATCDEDLEAILGLQRRNLPSVISAEEALAQGFVTVVHSLTVLRAMHAVMPSMVAHRDGSLVGYALSMPQAARELVPILEPMFQTLEGLRFREKSLHECRYYVMGQICVAREARGQGVFDALYDSHREHYASRFDCVITEVATRNTRSMRAHERVGFEVLHRFRDETDEWAVLAWDWLKVRDCRKKAGRIGVEAICFFCGRSLAAC